MRQPACVDLCTCGQSILLASRGSVALVLTVCSVLRVRRCVVFPGNSVDPRCRQTAAVASLLSSDHRRLATDEHRRDGEVAGSTPEARGELPTYHHPQPVGDIPRGTRFS